MLEVADEFCPWNAGSFRLHVGEAWGTGEVEPTHAPADITLHSSTLASVFLGGVAPSEFRVSGRIPENSKGAIARADRMFANDRPPYSLTNY